MKLFIVLLTGAFMLATGTSDVFAKKRRKCKRKQNRIRFGLLLKKGILNTHVCLKTKEW